MHRDRFDRLFRTKSRLVVGVMSGMSMDGLDFALARITGEFPALKVELLAAGQGAFDPALRERLLRARKTCDGVELCRLDMDVGRAFAAGVTTFLAQQGVPKADVDVVGSHGQTLVHLPPGESGPGSTLQLGPPSVIAEITGVPTVGNFRVRDMALGGHGAPLIPLLDFVLFRQEGVTRALNNLGSISNVTVIGAQLLDTFGFDTGPANMPIDHFARRVVGAADAIDRDAHLSRRGKVHDALLAALLGLPYFDLPPPKSAGYEEFGPRVLDGLAASHADCQGPDLVRTAVEFTVESIARAYEAHVLPRTPGLTSVLLTGGGAHHPLLVERLRARLAPLPVDTLPAQDAVMNTAKEALGMALLAVMYLQGRPASLPRVTGASAPAVLGELAL